MMAPQCAESPPAKDVLTLARILQNPPKAPKRPLHPEESSQVHTYDSSTRIPWPPPSPSSEIEDVDMQDASPPVVPKPRKLFPDRTLVSTRRPTQIPQSQHQFRPICQEESERRETSSPLQQASQLGQRQDRP